MVPAALFQKDNLNQKNYEYQQVHRDTPESSRLRLGKLSNPVLPSFSSSDSSSTKYPSPDHNPRKIPHSPGNLFSKSTGQDDRYEQSEKLLNIRNEELPPPVGLFGKLRQLTKIYGGAALVVYGFVGAVDFGLSFLMIYLMGAEHVKKAEDWFLQQINWKRAHSPPTTSNPGGSGIENNMLWTTVVVAYTIHKTILLPFRILLTAWLTPPIVRHLRKRGWKVGRNLE